MDEAINCARKIHRSENNVPGVIVKLQAAALNHIDVWTRLGVTGMAIPMLPILGANGAGIVIQVATGPKGLSTGDNVCLYPFTGCGKCGFCLTGRDLCAFM